MISRIALTQQNRRSRGNEVEGTSVYNGGCRRPSCDEEGHPPEVRGWAIKIMRGGGMRGHRCSRFQQQMDIGTDCNDGLRRTRLILDAANAEGGGGQGARTLVLACA
eukprot:CAMPEP_0174314720 /NCGR_PEP_ID=MMETSP0810-20121108/5828_1 /TAXON_ID=73025 ORGANISM="Eutreptiella gymnastica-like, Strain CCMP1594" /NCGR_SAMPLE_ID=MMETSP0810 /ASSEMBLY_ACC=CAM_ASM_000659 /LENGTH=106 /DNA_ID=CAMNT_0015423907 /DNA_START=472 /DNA_END=792 /DNA_ORIENTATION=-